MSPTDVRLLDITLSHRLLRERNDRLRCFPANWIPRLLFLGQY
jgi:hypothetical protein